MLLRVTEAGCEFRLFDSSVSTSVLSHCYLLLFYNTFQNLSLQLPWFLQETRSKGTRRTYRHQAGMLTRGLQSCKQRWSVDVLKQPHSAAAGSVEGVASLFSAHLALAAKWLTALKPQVVATAFGVCIACIRGQIRCGFLNAFSSPPFRTSRRQWPQNSRGRLIGCHYYFSPVTLDSAYTRDYCTRSSL